MNREQVRLHELKQIFRLVNEVCELGDNPRAWRAHMLQRLCAMVDARVGLACEHFVRPSCEETRLTGIVEHGWTAAERKIFHEYLATGEIGHDPLHAVTRKLAFRSFMRCLRDMVDDDSWYGSPIVELRRRAANLDDQIYSRQMLLQAGWSDTISILRDWGQKPFSFRDRRIIHLFHIELGRVMRAPDPSGSPEATWGMPPRLQETLDLLLQGMSEKQIAGRMNLSHHTVHGFVKRLHQRLGVTNRGELLSRGATRQADRRPRLSFDRDIS